MRNILSKLLGRNANNSGEKLRVEPQVQAGPGSFQTPALPKAPNKATALPSFKTQVARSASALTRTDRGLANLDITTYRTNGDTRTVMRDLSRSNPDLSATVNAYLRVGIPEDFTLVARDMDGQINADATKQAHELVRRLTFVGDASLGYNPSTSLQAISESLSLELLLCGAMSAELVLDKQRVPSYIQPVSVTRIQFKEEDGGVYPVQVLAGQEISLDIPTFIYESVDQDLLSAYAEPYLQSAIQAVLADAQFLNDLRRSMNRSIQPRLMATIIEDKVMNSLDVDTKNDPDKLRAFLDALIDGLTTQLTDLEPDDALVSFDSVNYGMLVPEGGSSNIAEVLSTVQKILEDKLTAGAKSLPAVLGRDAQSGSATTSTMLFMKNANILRTKLNTLYSRLFTVALRVLGNDVYAEFKYEPLDLRPKAELQAYKAMEQSSVIQMLSLGFITDEEACIRLTGNLPPEGYTPKSGTMFHTATGTIANPASQTSTMNQGGATDNLKPSTPAQPKS